MHQMPVIEIKLLHQAVSIGMTNSRQIDLNTLFFLFEPC
jgi:hypothetical protein